ncbi:hypothetical protein QUF72_06535 [Desulfobacterales bacterium HSG2]|nr:hypothetical protein [Desulfobacterales bacterium HSG2]
MSLRRVKIVLLCEDSQHEAFVRRFLKGMGWNTREMRVEKSPSKEGSAEQWVRENFPRELKIYRQRRQKAASALIAMIDADNKEVQERIDEFKTACNLQQMPFRTDDEEVALVVPRRNIETWIYFLDGNKVNEQEVYPKLDRERRCKSAVKNLVRFCKSAGLVQDAPHALTSACDEYRTRIRPFRKT